MLQLMSLPDAEAATISTYKVSVAGLWEPNEHRLLSTKWTVRSPTERCFSSLLFVRRFCL